MLRLCGMCGRYTVTNPGEAARELEAAIDPVAMQSEWWKPRFNVAPTQPAPVVIVKGGARSLELMRWGLMPFWSAKPGAKPPLMINARLESLHAKAVFRDALERKRCLVLADGFYEWANKTPLYIHPRDRRPIAFAGLWARAKMTTGELYSFTIITSKPAPLVAPFHDRMPLVLARDAWDAWLDPDTADPKRLLGIPELADWQVEQVSTHVNKADHDDPGCIAPISADPR
jgi:putative SOS response-associated peptidase YedK